MQKILVIGGGPLQIPGLRIAKKNNWQTVVVDRDENAPGKSLAHRFYQVDIYDKQGVLRVAQQEDVDGVAAYAIDAEEVAAYVTENLDLPGPPLDAAKTTRNKWAFYKAMHERFAMAPSMLQTHYLDVPISPPFDPPWIVRPLSSAGSVGTRIIHDVRQLMWWTNTAISNCRGEFKGAIISKFIEGGHEFSTEILLVPGQDPFYINSVYRPFWPKKNNMLIEIGHISPSPLDVHASLNNLCQDVARILGVEWGIVKIDTLVTEDETYLLEGTLRLSGGCDSGWTHPLVYHNYNITEEYMRLCLGESVVPQDGWLVATGYAAAVGWTLPAGKIIQPPAWNLFEETYDCQVVPRASEGTWDTLANCGSRGGFVVVSGDDWEGTWTRGLETALIVPGYYRYTLGA